MSFPDAARLDGKATELDRILERERQVVGGADDEDFIREMTGGGGEKRGYGFDAHTAERIYS